MYKPISSLIIVTILSAFFLFNCNNSNNTILNSNDHNAIVNHWKNKGRPIILAMSDEEINTYKTLSDLSNSDKIKFNKGDTIEWSESEMMIEEIGKAEFEVETNTGVVVYDTCISGVLKDGTMQEMIFKSGQTINLLIDLGEDSYLGILNNKYVETSLYNAKIISKPKSKLFIKLSNSNVWVEVDRKVLSEVGVEF